MRSPLKKKFFLVGMKQLSVYFTRRSYTESNPVPNADSLNLKDTANKPVGRKVTVHLVCVL